MLKDWLVDGKLLQQIGVALHKRKLEKRSPVGAPKDWLKLAWLTESGFSRLELQRESSALLAPPWALAAGRNDSILLLLETFKDILEPASPQKETTNVPFKPLSAHSLHISTQTYSAS